MAVRTELVVAIDDPLVLRHAGLGSDVDLVIILVPRDIDLDRLVLAALLVQQEVLHAAGERAVLTCAAQSGSAGVLSDSTTVSSRWDAGQW